MLDLGFALLLTLLATGLGARILQKLDLSPEHPVDRFGLAFPLGAGIVALAVLLLGQFQGLNVLALAILLGIVAEIGLLAGVRLAGALAKVPFGGGGATGVDRLMRVFLVATVAATAISALAPVTDGDALCYHLQVPKVFLMEGSAVFDPDLHETVYPLTTEMLYMIALAFRGPIACRGIQWMLGLAMAANITALARPSLGNRAWWAGAGALLVPAVTNGMAAPLNDVALAAFGTAAIAAWMRLHDAPGRKAAVLAGVFIGLAVGVKYPALVLAAMLGAGLALRPCFDRKASWKASLELTFWFAAALIAAGGAWYLRAYIHTGNPVHPFFRSWFGSGLDEVLDPIKRPLPVTLWNLLTAIGPLSLEPHRFDSFAHQFGPIFLLFLPALLLERAPRRVLGLVLLGYVFLMLCMTQRQSMRFLLIAVGPLSVGVAWLASTWRDRPTIPARVLTIALVGVLGLESCLAMARAGRAAGSVLGRETSVQFLARCEPTFRVGRWIGEHLPREARLIGQDHRGFYIPREYTMELAHRRRTDLGENGETDGELVEALRRQGYTHVMFCPPKGESDVEFDPTLGEKLAPWLASRRPLYNEELSDGDGLVRNYAIYELDGGGAVQ
ncbi:phospholipid carrier-dependent glycosyltransferase [Planctomyces sp. SH-PL62]|uniref:phospholipid carrier-dependent glycosyltransferase n=1 Tax=Planctomyces sp. SH-PL62 TaxID=1636152 RepID=UPI00078EA823|nr:phospholipid carrier-dependent glycosyltransferase [Planctomyces sp. SH-PL62]AMV39615.1 Dolichyl-phosphate-mannose-protein mannosyltransferase [Planctomyces sp. SH-PL62]